jgi:hypothetical protein
MGQPSPPSGGAAAPKRDPNQPETHAASGAGDSAIPKPTTSEPTLPDDPLAISKRVRARIGAGTPDEKEDGREDSKRKFRVIPPYFEEQSGSYRFRTVFPFWMERKKPNDISSLYSMLYFRRRSTKVNADVVFPFYWRWQQEEHKTTIVGPVGWHRSPKANDTFVAPFYFRGRRPDGGYLYIPPLLTFLKRNKYGGSTLIGPGFCFWKGGQTCNPETADEINWGIAPFYFAGKNEERRYEFALPLLHYYEYTELDQSWINIWGPVISAHYPKKDAFHVAPFFFHVWGANSESITIPPLMFHYGYDATSDRLLTPLFYLAHGEKGENTFVSWLYARHRGRTKLDMITPFYWHYQDPDTKVDRKLLFPFLYTSQSPRESNVAFFPFYAHFKRYGLSESTWITPFFEHTTSITGWETNLYPLVFLGRNRLHSHTVVAPIFFDFVTPKSRSTVGFPIYWRFSEGNTVSQLVLNTYYREKKLRNGLDWEFHFFPLFSYGETPNGHWWNVLYGLAGYTRSGAATKMRLMYIPIDLSQDTVH